LACRGIVEPRRVFLLPNVIDPSENSIAELSLPNTEPVQQDSVKAVFVGRLVPAKRVDRFIEAIGLARQRCPNLRGLIVGDGPERHNWENFAIQKGLCPPILTFIGQRDDVPNLLIQSAMLVLCSDDEGFPNVILEAMLARLPVITTPAGDSDIIVENEVNGYVVPFSDTCAMAERMVRLAESPELRRLLGEAGRQRVEQHYAYASLAYRLMHIYHKVAKYHKKCGLLRMLPDGLEVE
jgi:glycosyltransferase involved in cell wall biosynthesis